MYWKKNNTYIETGNKIAHQGMIIFLGEKKVFSFTLLEKIKFFLFFFLFKYDWWKCFAFEIILPFSLEIN